MNSVKLAQFGSHKMSIYRASPLSPWGRRAGGERIWRCKSISASALTTTAMMLLAIGSAQAGLHYSGETIAPLPSQWRGLMGDLRKLRYVGIEPTATQPTTPMRTRYEEAVVVLLDSTKGRPLSSEEAADLGALYLRLGEMNKALQVLRDGARRHPSHYPLISNLGTAWQLSGDLPQAARWLGQAVRMAPKQFQRTEEYQLKLVQLRMREDPRSAATLDNLFNIRFSVDSGEYSAGSLGLNQREKLPKDAVAIVQNLAVWLPGDGRLYWLLAELANAHGDIETANTLFELCINQFALGARELRHHRAVIREAILAKRSDSVEGDRTTHDQHAGRIVARSRRPLERTKLDWKNLPPISATGTNPLPWDLILETSVDRLYRPTFPEHLEKLHGHTVSMTGFMQPITEDLEHNTFMLIEFPTGCWFCEAPEITNIIIVELPQGRLMQFSRDMIKVSGRLRLNADDPEDFFFTLHEAQVGEAD